MQKLLLLRGEVVEDIACDQGYAAVILLSIHSCFQDVLSQSHSKHLHFAAPSTKRLFESCALYFHPVADIIETYRNHIAEIRNVWRIHVVLIDACAIEECINMYVK